MLYTRKGDKGTTKTLNTKDRISKASNITEALGTMDELNSFLGLCKVKVKGDVVMIRDEKVILGSIIEGVQKTLFIIQSQLAGSDKKLRKEKIDGMELIIDNIEEQLPPIKTFLVSGGTESGALFDIARTIARRAERRLITVHEEDFELHGSTIGYINRLSSLLYALARHANYKSGINETAPDYQ